MHEDKFKTVMREYAKGQLKTSAGTKAKNKKQGLAIAYSEARRNGQKV